MYQSQPPSRNNPPNNPPKVPIVVTGVPSVTVENNRLVVGNANTSPFQLLSPRRICTHPSLYYLASNRSYTTIKCLGDGTFGTVWLCDWHGVLPPNTPLSPMQCGAGARPEWAGKRLVAVKLMRKPWPGGWDECQKLKELQVRTPPPSLPVQPSDFSSPVSAFQVTPHYSFSP